MGRVRYLPYKCESVRLEFGPPHPYTFEREWSSPVIPVYRRQKQGLRQAR